MLFITLLINIPESDNTKVLIQLERERIWHNSIGKKAIHASKH